MRNRCDRGSGGRIARDVVVSVLVAVVLGGCWSGSATSAMPVAGARPEYEGPFVITRDDMVIEGMKILRPLVINANNVVIRNCLVQASTNAAAGEPLILVPSHTRGTVIAGNDIRGPEPSSGQQAVNGVKLYGDDIEFSNNEVSQVSGDGVIVGGTNLRVVNNYVHGFVSQVGGESDAVVFGGEDRTSRVLISRNRLEMWMPEGMASLISLPEVAPNMVVSENRLAGGTYAIAGGGGAATISGNRFSVRFSRHCGRLGTHLLQTDRDRQGVRWSENRWDDGPEAGREIGL
jgi:hypothetical protein